MIECTGGSWRVIRVLEEGVGVIDYRGGSWCDRVYRRELAGKIIE